MVVVYAPTASVWGYHQFPRLPRDHRPRRRWAGFPQGLCICLMLFIMIDVEYSFVLFGVLSDEPLRLGNERGMPWVINSKSPATIFMLREMHVFLVGPERT